MTPSCSRTLFIYFGIDSFPQLKGKIESAIVNSEEEAKERLLDGKDFSNVFVFRIGKSPDGTYVRAPFNQEKGIMKSVLRYLEKSGFDVGAYNNDQDRPLHRFIYTDTYRLRKVRSKIYEIVAPSMDSLRLCYDLLNNHFGDKQ